MKKLSSKEMLDLLDTQWAGTSEIKLIAQCGKNRALAIKNQIRKELENSNYYLPNNKIPMFKLVEYLGINIQYLKRVYGGSNAEK